MAVNGVPLETLMQFSGHKRVDTLKRYLDYGAAATAEHNSAYSAAAHLTAGTH
jgi:hypothetical protein